MRVWDLEREYDRFISFILDGREKKKRNVRSSVEAIKKEILSRKEKALTAFSRKWDRWERDYPFKLSEKELREGASSVAKSDLTVLRGMIRNVVSYHKDQKGKNLYPD